MSSDEDEWGIDHIFEAAETGYVGAIRSLINEGVDPNVRDGYGLTPLSTAADEGHTTAVRVLLELGANPNLQEFNFGENPLSTACSHGDYRMIEILLMYGANPNIETFKESLGLMYGANPNIETFKESLEEVVGNEERVAETPLMRIMEIADLEESDDEEDQSNADRNELLRIAQLLINHGANLNYKNINGQTPLTAATMSGPFEIVELFLEHGSIRGMNMAMHMTSTTPLGEENQKKDLLLYYYNKIQSKQRLAMATSMMTHDNIFSHMDYDTMKKLSNYKLFNSDIPLKVKQENSRNKYTQAKQRLALMKSMESREGPMSSVRYDPSLIEHISRHLSKTKPIHNVQKKAFEDDRKRETFEDSHIAELKSESGDIDWEEIYRENPELRPEQSGSGNRRRMIRHRVKTLKNKKKSALMKSMESREGPMSSVRYDPSLLEHISSYL
jgi:ankyrin repeat protein